MCNTSFLVTFFALIVRLSFNYKTLRIFFLLICSICVYIIGIELRSCLFFVLIQIHSINEILLTNNQQHSICHVCLLFWLWFGWLLFNFCEWVFYDNSLLFCDWYDRICVLLSIAYVCIALYFYMINIGCVVWVTVVLL